jgi:glycosyltransferase involved in cell wall biosynthesis
LMIVGLDKSQYAQSIRRYAKELLGADRLVDIGLTTMRDLPELMSVADLAVIPQRKTLESLGQVPARVFDAMAMAKPIIATNVSHLREIIEDCGWIVEPENTGELAENIREVLGDLKNAHVVGEKAREKCIRLYSYDAAERVLVEIFEHL